MKLLSLMIFAVVNSFGLAAMAEATQAQKDKNCASIGELAENVMKGRQNNVPMSTMMGIADSIEDSAEADVARKLVRQIIVMAYGQPAMAVPENQARSIADFRNTIEVSCYSAQ